MAIETRWIEVVNQIDICRQLARDWSLLVDDRPNDCDDWLTDQLSDTAQELRGWIHEIVALAKPSHRSASQPRDVDAIRRTLTQIQRHMDRIVSVQGRIRDELELLRQAVRRDRRRSTKWLRAVRESWHRLEHALQSLTKEVVACWQELADRAGQPQVMVSIHNENHGSRASVVHGTLPTTQ